ncbi:MAG: sigma-70 family RNA polymerase sigma factor [Aggregatilineales bacterium]
MADNTDSVEFYDEDPDYALIESMARGDARALDELYARHGGGILGYLTNFLRDRQLAEEVLQDVMLAAWNSAAKFRGDSKVRTWLLVIARNRAINTQRKKLPNFVPLEEDLNAYSTDTGPLEKVVRRSEHMMLKDAIQTLPPAHREILELVFFHQLTGPEIADVLGITVGTVKSRLHRAKETLRRIMQMMGEVSDA